MISDNLTELRGAVKLIVSQFQRKNQIRPEHKFSFDTIQEETSIKNIRYFVTFKWLNAQGEENAIKIGPVFEISHDVEDTFYRWLRFVITDSDKFPDPEREDISELVSGNGKYRLD